MLINQFTPHLIEAGVDEVGRGCLAGPVVAAAVIMPKGFNHPEICDSKLLTRTKREELKIIIIEKAIAWSVAEISNEEIDRINILNASIKAMHQALDCLKQTPEFILIDGNKFIPYKYIPYQCIVKGDNKFLSIASASILAKCHRDQLMQKLAIQYPDYGWEHNAGYPTPFHKKAIASVGPTLYHRKSFRWNNS